MLWCLVLCLVGVDEVCVGCVWNDMVLVDGVVMVIDCLGDVNDVCL